MEQSAGKKHLLHHLADDVSNQNVGLLDARGVFASRDTEEMINLVGHFSSVPPGEADGDDLEFSTDVKCRQDRSEERRVGKECRL